MANVVPKREPCVKCNNPVFFAERLKIHESLYHRTCFRCARCNSVLTYGNFYETEKDHEYCCETCPDEEKTTKVEESNRLTIAQKIALFERESSSVLKKSLSDEEKSKSLSRQSPAKSEALNSFLTTQITTQASDDEKTVDSVSSESEESEDEDSKSPPIPSNHPSDDIIPSISDKKITISDHKIISETPDNSVVTKEPHGKDIEAIATVAETHSESHGVRKDNNSAHLVLVDSFLNESEATPDDIDLLFEQLAEDAVKSPIVPIPIISRKSPSPIKQLPVEELVNENSEPITTALSPEPESAKRASVPEIILQQNFSQEKITSEEHFDLTAVPEIIEQNIYEEKVTNEEALVPTAVDVMNSSEDQNPDTNYPEDLDPFGDEEETLPSSKPAPIKRVSLNPFGSGSEEEDEKVNNHRPNPNNSGTLPKPPRPPLPKTMTLKPVSTNPFGSDDDEDEAEKSLATRTPVPTPRKPL